MQVFVCLHKYNLNGNFSYRLKMFPIRVIDNQKQTKTNQPKEKKRKQKQQQ